MKEALDALQNMPAGGLILMVWPWGYDRLFGLQLFRSCLAQDQHGCAWSIEL